MGLTEDFHPAEIVGQFIKNLKEDSTVQPFLSNCIRTSPLEEGSLEVSLISAFGYTNLMLTKLIFWVFEEIPSYFQLLRCSSATTEEDIELFFDRIDRFQQDRYLIIGANIIRNDLQRVCCSQTVKYTLVYYHPYIMKYCN